MSDTKDEKQPKNGSKIDKMKYEKELVKLQIELLKLQAYVKEKNLKVLIIMEGRDAAGKGGTIKRITEHLNPRGCRVVALSKPSNVETTQWYFQRYVAHLPSGGEIVIFDRSWYNRAMVEPVMGFCTPREHMNFLQDVPNFENLLSRSGIIILKFFLSITKDTQEKRFKERKSNPLKTYKMSPVDNLALKMWNKYSVAQYNMFLQTDTENNPWIIVDSNDKKRARINTIKSILNRIDYSGKCSPGELLVDNKLVRGVKEELEIVGSSIEKMGIEEALQTRE